VSRGSISTWVILNILFYGEGLLAPRPTPNPEDHPSSAVRGCLFNLFTSTLHIGGRSSIRNLRTRHVVVTGTHIHGAKNTRVTKTLCSQYYGKTKQKCKNTCIWSSGECNGWPVSRHEPLDTNPPPSPPREIGQQGGLLANLMLHVFTYCWFEMTWKLVT
jgi:hypothetical protein